MFQLCYFSLSILTEKHVLALCIPQIRVFIYQYLDQPRFSINNVFLMSYSF